MSSFQKSGLPDSLPAPLFHVVYTFAECVILNSSRFENEKTLLVTTITYPSSPRTLRFRVMDTERTFFVTTITAQRRPIFRDARTAELLIDVLSHYRSLGKFLLHEFVIMPDHVHVLLSPAPEISLERAMQFIKGGFSFRLGTRSKGAIWQESFTNHRIRDEADYGIHRGYIRMNPVRAGLVARAEEYAYSSANSRFSLDEIPPGLKPAQRRSA